MTGRGGVALSGRHCITLRSSIAPPPAWLSPRTHPGAASSMASICSLDTLLGAAAAMAAASSNADSAPIADPDAAAA